MKIYLIRHGDPDYSIDSLTERGHTEAEALAGYLAGEDLAAIHSSPLGRAQATAAYTAKRVGLPIQIEEWTRELSLRLADTEAWLAAWNVHGHDVRTPEYLTAPSRLDAVPGLPVDDIRAAESAIREGSDAFLAGLGYVRESGVYRVVDRNTRHIAVFCHGGFGLTWLAVLLEIPIPLVWTGFFLHTSSVTQILLDEREPGIATPRCVMMSALPHIHRDGLTVGTSGLVANTD